MKVNLAAWELVGLSRQLDELLNLLAVPPEQHVAAWAPPVDLMELPDRYLARIDLPGVAAGDVRVTFVRSRLRITGRRVAGGERYAGAHCLRAERSHGRFFLEIRVPPGTLPGSAKATLKDGVLEISLPRCSDDSEPILIPVSAEEP